MKKNSIQKKIEMFRNALLLGFLLLSAAAIASCTVAVEGNAAGADANAIDENVVGLSVTVANEAGGTAPDTATYDADTLQNEAGLALVAGTDGLPIVVFVDSNTMIAVSFEPKVTLRLEKMGARADLEATASFSTASRDYLTEALTDVASDPNLASAMLTKDTGGGQSNSFYSLDYDGDGNVVLRLDKNFFESVDGLDQAIEVVIELTDENGGTSITVSVVFTPTSQPDPRITDVTDNPANFVELSSLATGFEATLERNILVANTISEVAGGISYASMSQPRTFIPKFSRNLTAYRLYLRPGDVYPAALTLDNPKTIGDDMVETNAGEYYIDTNNAIKPTLNIQDQLGFVPSTNNGDISVLSYYAVTGTGIDTADPALQTL